MAEEKIVNGLIIPEDVGHRFFDTHIIFKNGEELNEVCITWPEVKDGWLILEVANIKKERVLERKYYHREDIKSVNSKID